MRRNLVIARVGERSLHGGWVDPEAERNWDLYLCPYQPVEHDDRLDCTVGEVIPGPKWTGLRELLRSWNGWRDYEQVWLPDDYIAFAQHTINELFDAASRLALDLFAPALDTESYFAHFNTVQNTSFFGRWVAFIEIMAPAFRTTALSELLPTLDHTATGWAWGLDAVWPKLLGYEGIAILDGLTVNHIRPVGAFRDDDLRRQLVKERDAMTDHFGCETILTTFGGFDRDLRPMERTPAQLLVDLVRGWDHTFDRDPSQLGWIVEFQRRTYSMDPYPVGGTPN